jgi:hypothetical protein
MSEQDVTEQNGVETPAEVAPAAAPELNINDLVAMRNVIDVVSKRGAFQANELSSVGQLFDKLNAFLDAAQKAQPAVAPAQGE